MEVEVAEVAEALVMLLRELTLLQVGGAHYFLPGGGSFPPPSPMHASRTHFNPPECTCATPTI